jgi:hypothetical protein
MALLVVVALALCTHFSSICSIVVARSCQSSVTVTISIGGPSTCMPSVANLSLSLMLTLSAVFLPKVT